MITDQHWTPLCLIIIINRRTDNPANTIENFALNSIIWTNCYPVKKKLKQTNDAVHWNVIYLLNNVTLFLTSKAKEKYLSFWHVYGHRNPQGKRRRGGGGKGDPQSWRRTRMEELKQKGLWLVAAATKATQNRMR